MPNLKLAVLVAGLMGSAAALQPAFAQTATPAPAAEPSAPAAAGSQPSPSPQTATPLASQASSAARADSAKKEPDPAQTRLHDRVAFFNARIAALHAGLMLDADQQKLWPPLEQAIRDLAKARYHEGRIAREGRQMIDDREDAASDAKPFELLKQTGEELERHGRALQALSDAAAPLYASLTNEQKNRLPELLEDLAPRRGPMARLLAMIEPDHRGRYDDRDRDHDDRRAEDRHFDGDHEGDWRRHDGDQASDSGDRYEGDHMRHGHQDWRSHDRSDRDDE